MNKISAKITPQIAAKITSVNGSYVSFLRLSNVCQGLTLLRNVAQTKLNKLLVHFKEISIYRNDDPCNYNSYVGFDVGL